MRSPWLPRSDVLCTRRPSVGAVARALPAPLGSRYLLVNVPSASAMAEPAAAGWWYESVGSDTGDAVPAQRNLWHRLFPDDAVPGA